MCIRDRVSPGRFDDGPRPGQIDDEVARAARHHVSPNQLTAVGQALRREANHARRRFRRIHVLRLANLLGDNELTWLKPFLAQPF